MPHLAGAMGVQPRGKTDLMPTRWALTLRRERPSVERSVTPEQLHGLTAALLEGAGADHHAQHKPYLVSPLMAADRSGTAVLRIGWLQDSLHPDLAALRSAGAPRRA